MALSQKVIILSNTGLGSWSVPGDWNSLNNTIHLIGGGGGGDASVYPGSTLGVGGGGGGYTKITNFSTTPGTAISYIVGNGGTNGGGHTSANGNNTTFSSNTYVAGGGVSGYYGSTGGIGSTYSGGSGSIIYGGGGGGAAGPNGAGQSGSANTGGSGDAGFGGSGGINTGTTVTAGSNGTEIAFSIGSGGGGSGNGTGAAAININQGGLYGGGGGGSSLGNSNYTGAGAQGVIIIVYTSIGSGYLTDDPIFGIVDLDDQYITDQWLVDQFVGNQMFIWGSNLFTGGSIGNINSSPIQVGALTNWSQISTNAFAGVNTIAGIKTDGTLWMWGDTGWGELGNKFVNNTSPYSSPIQVGALTNWKYVSAGGLGTPTAAIKTDGTLWMWGYNPYGQLGNGNTNPVSSPIQVGSLTNWKYVTTSQLATLAIQTNGTLWAWGVSSTGQLGNGSYNVQYSSPVQVGSLTNWKYVNCNLQSTLAIKTDGTLWGWGGDQFGTIGSATITYSSPIQIGSLTNWKYLGMGDSVSAALAIKTDGTLWAWGRNDYGQLGNGTINIYYSSPIQIGSLTNWKQVSSGSGATYAIKTDGTLWGWGQLLGAFGTTTFTYYSSPVQIGSLTNWKQVSSGGFNAVAINFADIT